jgi:dimethylargininase
VRGVPVSFDRAIRPGRHTAPIDIELARAQHAAYCAALESLGLRLVHLDADDRFPDCCFVEDAGLVIDDLAVVTRPGAESRRGEVDAVEAALRNHRAVQRIAPPATLDGGDVLRIGGRLYVGLSGRTTSAAVGQLERLVGDGGVTVVPLPVRGILHLKSACTYLGAKTIVMRAGHLDEAPFSDYRIIPVPPGEAHAANCLAVNGVVMVPAEAPQTRRRIEAAGFETLELDISESRKAGGGLTCSSIIF